jgi:uracil-DNA glycosylase
LGYLWKFDMKDHVSSHVHSSWEPIFEPISGLIESLLSKIENEDIAPPMGSIFRAFEMDVASVRCVIVGQDPYPTPGNAMGLAFSVAPAVERIPPSLKNILKELESDQGVPLPNNGDLSRWVSGGVLLLNRILTTRVGESDAHKSIGWQAVTDHIASELGNRGVVAVLWGNQAQELAQYFSNTVESVHPSPLSAHRGFFGSKPFSRVNEILNAIEGKPIDWSL